MARSGRNLIVPWPVCLGLWLFVGGCAQSPSTETQEVSAEATESDVGADGAVHEQAGSAPVAPFPDEKAEGKYGFIDRHGRVVLKPKYQMARRFIEGLAEVELDGQIGFIDASGRMRFMLSANTREVSRLSEGRVWFADPKTGKWGLIDASGNMIIEPKYDQVRPFADGLAAVNVGAKRQFPFMYVGGKWGYVDHSGKLKIRLKFESVDDFSEGLACVSDGTSRRFIDRAGKPVLELKDSSSCGAFHGGLAPVHLDSPQRTRFINREGATAFELEGFVGEFHNGLARLSRRPGPNSAGRVEGFIDRNGKIVIPPTFNEGSDFSEGLAAVLIGKTIRGKGDSWGYVDKSGQLRIQPQFNEAGQFQNGLALVHIGGQLQVVFDAPSFWKGGEWW